MTQSAPSPAPHTGNSEATSSTPNNPELLELSPPPRPCQQCGEPLPARKHGGGSPKRFCGPDCRQAFHKEAQRFQRSPACALASEISDPAPGASPENAPAASPNEFDWSKDDDAVVLHHQPAVAVYVNANGGLTIRQQRDWDQEEDVIIAIAADNVMTFVDKLTDIAGIPSFGK